MTDSFSEIISLLVTIHMKRPDMSFTDVLSNVGFALNDKMYASNLRDYYQIIFKEENK